MNNLIFPAKFSSTGFLINQECIIYYKNIEGKFLIIININYKIIGYLIDINDIVAIYYDLNIFNEMKLTLELNTTIYFEYDIKLKNIITEVPNIYYINLMGNQKYFLNLLKNNEKSILKNLKGKTNCDLPYWCVWICFLDPEIRILIQYIMIYIEFCMFSWSLYQIYITFPDLIFMIKMSISKFVNYYVNGYIIILLIKLYEYIYYILYFAFNILVYPLRIVGNNIKFFVQLKIISRLDISLFKQLLTDTLNILSILNKNIKFLSNVKTGDISNYTKIKINIQYLWQFFIKPIKYIYDTVKAPLIGEFGRKIKYYINKYIYPSIEN